MQKAAKWAALGGAIAGALYIRHGRLLAPIPALALDPALLRHRFFLVACVAAWPVFSLYWQAAARNAAPAKSAESQASRGLHVFLTNVALLLVIAPIRGIGRLLPAAPLVMAAGILVEAAGLWLAIWARRHLGRNWSGEIAIKVDHQLVRSGPYRLLRHPIYTGILAMYAGSAVVTGERLAAIGFALAALAYGRKIRLEEANLEVAFGAGYHAYRRTTWALLPGLF